MSLSSISWSMVSKALDRSIATVIVRFTGFFWLSPFVMWLLIFCSAVVVECPFRKPCWCLARFTESVISGRRIFSSILARGDSRDIGR